MKRRLRDNELDSVSGGLNHYCTTDEIAKIAKKICPYCGSTLVFSGTFSDYAKCSNSSCRKEFRYASALGVGSWLLIDNYDNC